ncbi:hypothetical protein EON63_17555 [archaeon]|nr:MAG: hypothetical protein EON63_17555 [archaeon]
MGIPIFILIFLPIHIITGSMSEAVKFQVRYWTAEKGGLQEGDVLVSNHPQLAGGSHLPDITVITPVFWYGYILIHMRTYIQYTYLHAHIHTHTHAHAHAQSHTHTRFRQGRIIFYVASRGHHADVGGIAPGRLLMCMVFMVHGVW